VTINRIETKDLTKYLDHVPVVEKVNLQIPAGNLYGIIGPNGAGKSTLLKLIIGYYWPTSGVVCMDGKAITPAHASIRKTMQFVQNEWNYYHHFMVSDLIKYYGLLYDQFDHSRCARLLHALELSEKSRVRSFSLGMKMQLQLALSLSTRPSVLLLDEPTNGLDPIVKRQVLQLIVQEAAEDGTTIIMATHHLDDLDRIADGVAVMHKGQLVVSETIDTLKMKFKEINAVLLEGIPAAVCELPSIISISQKGNYYTITVKDDVDVILVLLREAGAIHFEVTDLSFDELFMQMMAKEGYSRESLLL
jgi:ABC-2 type transport system ATP-binding protein